MEEFLGKDEGFVADWLVRQGLEKLVDVFKGAFRLDMAGLPIRTPSVDALSPQELSYETVEVDKIYIPANALIVAENELIFLAIANILKELKAVLIGRAGYVYFGKINCRVVFLLKSRGPFAVTQTIKTLKPKAGIFLGFAKSLQSRPYEIGDVIVAEAILRKNFKHGMRKLESLACSECLTNVFENGKYGWAPPKYRKQAVHVGKVLQMGDFTKNERASAVALKTTSLDVTECCKGLGREWISIVGVIDTQRHHGDASWEQYVAVVMSSLVNKVLQDDQVFAILGGEGREPRRHSPLAGNPLQETVSLKECQFTGSDISLHAEEGFQRQAAMYWKQVKDALDKGFFHLQHQHRTQSDISLQDELNITRCVKAPVENSDQANDRKTALAIYKQATKEVPPSRKPKHFETGSQQRLLFLPSSSAEERKSAPSQRKLSGHAQICPTLISSMAVTMQSALLPLGVTLQKRGSCLEIIRIRTEGRATVSRQRRVLPPIPQGKSKV